MWCISSENHDRNSFADATADLHFLANFIIVRSFIIENEWHTGKHVRPVHVIRKHFRPIPSKIALPFARMENTHDTWNLVLHLFDDKFPTFSLDKFDLLHSFFRTSEETFTPKISRLWKIVAVLLTRRLNARIKKNSERIEIELKTLILFSHVLQTNSISTLIVCFTIVLQYCTSNSILYFKSYCVFENIRITVYYRKLLNFSCFAFGKICAAVRCILSRPFCCKQSKPTFPWKFSTSKFSHREKLCSWNDR